MNAKLIRTILILIVISVPLVYGLMPNMPHDNYGGPVRSSSNPHDNYDPHAGQPGNNQAASENFPEEISGMQLVSVSSGEQAMQAVNGMHGMEIEVEEAYIATYQSEGQSAIIWISTSKDEAEAKELFQVMDEKMPNSESFTQYHAFSLKGQEYRYVWWPKRSMHNYYYVIGTKNYWVAVSLEDPMPFLAEMMKKF